MSPLEGWRIPFWERIEGMEITKRLDHVAVKLCDPCMIILIDLGVPHVLGKYSDMVVDCRSGCQSLVANGRSRYTFPIKFSAIGTQTRFVSQSGSAFRKPRSCERLIGSRCEDTEKERVIFRLEPSRKTLYYATQRRTLPADKYRRALSSGSTRFPA
jgi:hypothetical protein